MVLNLLIRSVSSHSLGFHKPNLLPFPDKIWRLYIEQAHNDGQAVDDTHALQTSLQCLVHQAFAVDQKGKDIRVLLDSLQSEYSYILTSFSVSENDHDGMCPILVPKHSFDG